MRVMQDCVKGRYKKLFQQKALTGTTEKPRASWFYNKFIQKITRQCDSWSEERLVAIFFKNCMMKK